MHDICMYHIKVQGQVDKDTFNASSPLQMTMVREEAHRKDPAAATLFTVRADQSGLIGLLRHLHGHGFVLLSIYRKS